MNDEIILIKTFNISHPSSKEEISIQFNNGQSSSMNFLSSSRKKMELSIILILYLAQFGSDPRLSIHRFFVFIVLILSSVMAWPISCSRNFDMMKMMKLFWSKHLIYLTHQFNSIMVKARQWISWAHHGKRWNYPSSLSCILHSSAVTLGFPFMVFFIVLILSSMMAWPISCSRWITLTSHS